MPMYAFNSPCLKDRVYLTSVQKTSVKESEKELLHRENKNFKTSIHYVFWKFKNFPFTDFLTNIVRILVSNTLKVILVISIMLFLVSKQAAVYPPVQNYNQTE